MTRATVVYPPDQTAIRSILTPGGLGWSVFLAGTIDNGNSVDWQTLAEERLAERYDYIFNPRRKDWDSSWVQSESNSQFKEQVEWELRHIELASRVLMYFAPGSLSPITLLELGLIASSAPNKLTVCCPDGFWRKGNVDVVCSAYGVRRANNLDELLNAF